jgi:hypothetical protein
MYCIIPLSSHYLQSQIVTIAKFQNLAHGHEKLTLQTPITTDNAIHDSPSALYR